VRVHFVSFVLCELTIATLLVLTSRKHPESAHLLQGLQEIPATGRDSVYF